MPSRRMIDPAFWQSETVASLNIEQRYLFIGLFSNADDQGRLRGHPALIRNTIFPYDEVALEQVERDLKALEAIGTIILYQVEGKTFIQIANWWKYQRPQWAYPSEYPASKDWNDRLRYRAGGEILTHNWKGELDATGGDDNPGDSGDDLPPDSPSPNGIGHPLPAEDDYIDEADEISLPKALPKELPKALAEGEKTALGIELGIESKDEDEESRTRIREEKVAAIMELYQNNITISVAPITAQEMLSDEFLNLPLEWWQEAVKIAGDNNIRKWTYIRGILSRSIQIGLSPVTAGPPVTNKGAKPNGNASRKYVGPAPDHRPESTTGTPTVADQIKAAFRARARTGGDSPQPEMRPLRPLSDPDSPT